MYVHACVRVYVRACCQLTPSPLVSSMFSSVKAFEGQHYSTLKRQCLQSGVLFQDPCFAATDDSLFHQGNRIGHVVWKRPRVSADFVYSDRFPEAVIAAATGRRSPPS